jgi:hypothetical protein
MLAAAAALGIELEVVTVKHATKARKDLSKQNEFRIRAVKAAGSDCIEERGALE